MKIGILTFHDAHNYGAMLQCYALQQYLIEQNYITEVIDYRPDFYKQQYAMRKLSRCLCKNPINAIKNIYYGYFLFNLRCKSFNTFHRNYIITSKMVCNQDIPEDYDVYIVGSDQIWNPVLTNGFQDVFFCIFKHPKGNKRYISYAPSMETIQLSDSQKNYLRNALSRFDAISVREKTLISLLQPLVNTRIRHVCDPTLLADPHIWTPMIHERLIKKPYVVLYQIRECKEARILAENIAKQINGVVVELTSGIDRTKPTKYQTSSPFDFVNYMAYADYIVTTSFHGTAFSLIFNRPFYTFALGDNFDSRSSDLLEELSLEERLINTSDIVEISPIDYNKVNDRLNQYRDKSREFLKTALF